jgi:restriction system protein
VTVPDFQSLMRPCLAVHEDGQPRTSADVRDRIAELMQVTAEDRAILLPSGSQPLFTNRVAWAVTHLAQVGLLDRPSRGITQITARGQEVLRQRPDRVDMKVLRQFPEYEEFRTRTRQRKGQPERALGTVSDTAQDELAPREAITEVIDSAHSAVAADLLARVLKQPPVFLEQLVLRLLVRMGYGGLETPTEHLGGPGDAGLDGLIRLDTLGLDVVYVQAKRYTDQHVGRPDIQAFVGALHGAQASHVASSPRGLCPATADRVPLWRFQISYRSGMNRLTGPARLAATTEVCSSPGSLARSHRTISRAVTTGRPASAGMPSCIVSILAATIPALASGVRGREFATVSRSGLRGFPGASSATSPSVHFSSWLTGSFLAWFPSATVSIPTARKKTTGPSSTRDGWASHHRGTAATAPEPR